MKIYSPVDSLGFSTTNRVLGMFSDWCNKYFSGEENRLPIANSIPFGEVDSIS